MRFSDETIMAFADGELGEPDRSAVEQAMQRDPALAAKVARHQALRDQVFAAFAGILDEPVPARLRPATRSAKVVHLDSVRAARHQPPAAERPPRRWAWPEWGALAAMLVLGVLGGSIGLAKWQGDGALVVAQGNGVLSARGVLDKALTQQLAAAPPAKSPVAIGVSFVAKDGTYCRSFRLASAAGLACRDGKQWNIPVIADTGAATPGAYRQAASAMPAAVMDMIDQRSLGASLDAKAEQAAALKGWRR